MRLIDVDELKYCRIVKAVMSPMGSAMLKEVKIKDVSTAYDVDKVVEQLENAKTNFIGMGTIQSAYFDKGIDKAIEIVKSGSVAND